MENGDQESWRSDPASRKQLDFIRTLGGTPRPDMTKGDASDMIEELKSNREWDGEPCEKCGTFLEEGIRFCPECGTRVDGEDGDGEEQATDEGTSLGLIGWVLLLSVPFITAQWWPSLAFAAGILLAVGVGVFFVLLALPTVLGIIGRMRGMQSEEPMERFTSHPFRHGFMAVMILAYASAVIWYCSKIIWK